METNQNNTIMDAMKVQPIKTQAISQESVNSSAENILNTVATIGLCVGIVASIILLFTGFGQMGNWTERDQIIGLILCGVSVLTLVLFLIQWAFMKTFINISRNLFNLNHKVDSIKGKLNSLYLSWQQKVAVLYVIYSIATLCFIYRNSLTKWVSILMFITPHSP